MTLLAWNPSPNTRNAFPTRSRSGACCTPAKQHVLGQAVLVHRQEQYADAWAPVQCFALRELALDPRLALAADHGCREAGHRGARLARPARVLACDDDACGTHRERLRE